MLRENLWRPVLECFCSVRVLVVGDAMLDHYVIGNVSRISPEAPVPILHVREEFDRLGGAANVAANVVALGGKTALFSLVGHDSAGQVDRDGLHLQEKCVDGGIDARLLPSLGCTIRKTRMMAGRQQMLRVDWEPVPEGKGDVLRLSESDCARRQSMLQQALEDADVVLVSDYAKGTVDEALMQLLVQSGKPVVVDPRPRNAGLYKGISLITPNRKEAGEILGLDGTVRYSGCELAEMIRDKLACDALVTLGEEGMVLCPREGQMVAIPTRAREVFDVTGAGDTVAATIALARGAGANWELAAQLANAAAGVVVGHIGTASVTADELAHAILS